MEIENSPKNIKVPDSKTETPRESCKKDLESVETK